jgi:hypothetical protein
MSDLRQRVPGHSLIDELLHQWDIGSIHLGERPDEVVIDEEARGWYRGVIGERRIASLLDQLGDEWTVLHSVPVGSGTTDIDHIAIGPTGVFTINTKYSPGKDVWVAGVNMMVGGRRQRYVHNTLREVIRADAALQRATGLDVAATGVIVFVDPKQILTRERPGSDVREVRVVSDRELLAALHGTTMLMPHEIERVVAAAIRPETWHQWPAESTIGAYITREFVALEEAVGPRLAAPVVSTVKPRVAAAQAPRRSASSRPARNANSRPASRSSGRRRGRSRLEALVGAAAFIALAYFISRPEGQAVLSSLLTSLLVR